MSQSGRLTVLRLLGNQAAGPHGGKKNDIDKDFINVCRDCGGGITALSALATKTIKVKFEVLADGVVNWSKGIVGTQDNGRLIYDEEWHSDDYTVTIIAPAGDEYLNVGGVTESMPGKTRNGSKI